MRAATGGGSPGWRRGPGWRHGPSWRRGQGRRRRSDTRRVLEPEGGLDDGDHRRVFTQKPPGVSDPFARGHLRDHERVGRRAAGQCSGIAPSLVRFRVVDAHDDVRPGCGGRARIRLGRDRHLRQKTRHRCPGFRLAPRRHRVLQVDAHRVGACLQGLSIAVRAVSRDEEDGADGRESFARRGSRPAHQNDLGMPSTCVAT